MLVHNFLTTPSQTGPSHAGVGVIRNTTVYSAPDFDSPLSFINYSEIDPGNSIGIHRHGANEEIYVILEGVGRMTVNGEVREVRAGDVLLNKPGWEHGLENNSEDVLKILVFEAAVPEAWAETGK
jgi:quercetin dioxygenase-like cupin family protein